MLAVPRLCPLPAPSTKARQLQHGAGPMPMAATSVGARMIAPKRRRARLAAGAAVLTVHHDAMPGEARAQVPSR